MQRNVATQITAWDLPTRIFHWALVFLMAWAWISFRYAESFGDYLLKWHRWNGLLVLTLLVWRLLWGIFGSPTSRFSNFVRGPRAAFAYGRDLLAGRRRKFLGHNPLGAWMVIALLAAVIGQASLGLFTVEHNDLTAGPFYRLVSEAATKTASRWHAWSFHYVLLPLVVLHVTANVLYGLIKKEPLIPAMITGRKPRDDYEDGDDAIMVGRPMLRAGGLLAVAATIVLGGIKLAAGRIV